MQDTCIEINSIFKGDLKSENNALILGTIMGKINAKNTVDIQATGNVKGDISSNIVMASGKIEGNITASKAVILKDNSIVIGNIKTPSIIIEERSSHNGNLILT